MATGTVVRFDEVRGYGFVAPDMGGEDVFIHVNDLSFDKNEVTQGARVEFEVEESDRGLKASRIDFVASQNSFSRRPSPVNSTSSTGTASTAAQQSDYDELCDVLSTHEFRDEMTEILLNAAPSMTAEQVLLVRERLVKAGTAHGWIES